MRMFWRRVHPPHTQWTLETIRGFLRCGGTFSTREWAAMSPEVRDAVEAVSVTLEQERALTLAYLIQNPEVTDDSLRPPKSPEAEEDALIRQTMERAAARALSLLRAAGGP